MQLVHCEYSQPVLGTVTHRLRSHSGNSYETRLWVPFPLSIDGFCERKLHKKETQVTPEVVVEPRPFAWFISLIRRRHFWSSDIEHVFPFSYSSIVTSPSWLLHVFLLSLELEDFPVRPSVCLNIIIRLETCLFILWRFCWYSPRI
jgi:hypothetical protein